MVMLISFQLSSVWKDESQNLSYVWKRFIYAEDAGIPKNVQELEDFSEEQQGVELLRTSAGLMNNYHKTEKQSWIIQETTQSIKIQGYVNFWMGSFFYKCYYYCFLWSIYKHLLCEILCIYIYIHTYKTYLINCSLCDLLSY